MMPRERVAPQFEVIRAVMVDGSPYVLDKQGTYPSSTTSISSRKLCPTRLERTLLSDGLVTWRGTHKPEAIRAV